MDIDNELATLEEYPQTEAELIDQESEVYDSMSDMDDEYLPADSMESDMEHAFSSFMTASESDYNGYDPSSVAKEEIAQEISDMFYSGGVHIEVAPDYYDN